uniref:Uncharacterized protein n=1 Tax=Cacopsylla melanoneura TaxID=428564 RepID=A0A8D9BWH9_9HEMI
MSWKPNTFAAPNIPDALVDGEVPWTVLSLQFCASFSSDGVVLIICVSPPVIPRFFIVILSTRKVSNFPIVSEIDWIYFRLNLVFGTNSANLSAEIPKPLSLCLISGRLSPII